MKKGKGKGTANEAMTKAAESEKNIFQRPKESCLSRAWASSRARQRHEWAANEGSKPRDLVQRVISRSNSPRGLLESTLNGND